MGKTLDELWRLRAPQRKRLMNDAATFFYNMPEISKAFIDTPDNRILACVDEGITRGYQRVAGAGCLVEEEDLPHFIEEIHKAGITGIKSHEGCGAWALYCQKHPAQQMTVQEWTQSFAKQAGISYEGHINELQRPHEHDAAVIYYITTPIFNRAVVPDLPQGFTVTRRYFSGAARDLALCINIAFGAHGNSNRFGHGQDALRVIVVSDPMDLDFSMTAIREADKVIEEAKLLYGERIIFDAFRAPAPTYT